MKPVVREICSEELAQLLALYSQLHEHDPRLVVDEQVLVVWNEILHDPHHHCLGVFIDGVMVSSCVLVIIPNLTRGARPYALIENVVTQEGYRRCGCGSLLLKKAVEAARERNCYKVMLMTSRKDEGVAAFYTHAGFDGGDKTAFVMRL